METEAVRQQVRQSLGLPAGTASAPTFPVEGHCAEFPMWAYSKKRSRVTELRIDYPDGSFFKLDAPKGLPSVHSPGFLDILLFYGQKDLFYQNYVELSAYRIFQHLDLDPSDGRTYQHFRRDMERFFSMSMQTDRFIHPQTRQRSHIAYFRVLDTMLLAKRRQGVSQFFFNAFFLQSFRAGYLKRLDLDFCLHLDRQPQPLARFLYGHLLKRLGGKSGYTRHLVGLLHDAGFSHLTDKKRQTELLKRSVYPALDLIKGHAFKTYHVDPKKDSIFFIPTD